MAAESKERVDHRAKAEQCLDRAGRTAVTEEDRIRRHHREAQVHASLAIAEQLERLNDTLAHVVNAAGPGGYLKVRNG